MNIKNILNTVKQVGVAKSVIGKTLPINPTSAPMSKKAKVAAVLAAGAGLMGAVAQYLS